MAEWTTPCGSLAKRQHHAEKGTFSDVSPLLSRGHHDRHQLPLRKGEAVWPACWLLLPSRLRPASKIPRSVLPKMSEIAFGHASIEVPMGR
jgi:hypothetical protein